MVTRCEIVLFFNHQTIFVYCNLYIVQWNSHRLHGNFVGISGSPEKKLQFVKEEQLKQSFAEYRNKMATVDDLYERWANQKGAGCAECALLADYFSIAVDSAKTGE